jgi:hypothetical protein
MTKTGRMKTGKTIGTMSKVGETDTRIEIYPPS